MRLTPGILLVAALVIPRASVAQSTTPGQPIELPMPPPPDGRIFVDLGLVGSASSLSKSRSFLGYFVKFGEVGSTNVSYPRPSRATLTPALDLGGGYMILPNLAVGVSYTRTTHHDGATLTTTAPHPDLFNTPASDNGVTNALERQEITTAVYGAWAPAVSSRVKLRFFGGPAFFAYSANMVKAATYTQSAGLTPPLNTITVDGSVNQEATARTVGFTFGGDVAYFFNRRVGLSGGLRYSRGTVTLQHEPLSNVRQDIRVGSTMILMGMRFRFGG